MVLLGAHRVDENFKATKKMIVKPTNYRIHRQFNRTTLAFDIALIILPSKITFSKSIQPVELPSGFLLTERFSGELATVAGELKITFEENFWSRTIVGWGLTCDGCGNAKTLRFTQSRVMQNSECSKKLKNPNIPSINQICFSKIGSGSPCLGDSGSPLTIVRKDTVIQIALHSQGNKKCETEFPTIFMRLTKQIVEWITEEVLDAWLNYYRSNFQ